MMEELRAQRCESDWGGAGLRFLIHGIISRASGRKSVEAG